MSLTGSCHCGQIAFDISADLPEKLTRCTCSFCSKRGTLYLYCAPDDFHAHVQGHDAIYRWQTKLVAHHFCGNCGCTTWSDSPAFGRDGSWDGKTRRIGVNARLIDGLDAATHPVEVIDGKNLW